MDIHKSTCGSVCEDGRGSGELVALLAVMVKLAFICHVGVGWVYVFQVQFLSVVAKHSSVISTMYCSLLYYLSHCFLDISPYHLIIY